MRTNLTYIIIVHVVESQKSSIMLEGLAFFFFFFFREYNPL